MPKIDQIVNIYLQILPAKENKLSEIISCFQDHHNEGIAEILTEYQKSGK